MMKKRTRVVITGVGVVSPLGCSKEELWHGVANGKSAIVSLPDSLRKKMGDKKIGYAPVSNFSPPKGLEKVDRQIQFVVSATQQALIDADLISSPLYDKGAVYVSSSKGGVASFEKEHHDFLEKKNRQVSSSFLNNFLSHTPSQVVANEFQITGPILNWVAACASGAHALLQAHRLLQFSPDKVVIAGSTEASLTPFILSGFYQMGVLAESLNSQTDSLCKPFDLNRTGFAPGEGSAIFILESLEHATERGVHIYAELCGGAAMSDAHHMVHFDPSGESIARVIKRSLEDARRGDEIDYINLHATATKENDWIETRGLKRVWKKATMPALSGTKPITGHLLGASGALEALITLLALQNQFVPPTLNLIDPDPECDLDYTSLSGCKRTLQRAMSLSYGFGGHTASLIFQKWKK